MDAREKADCVICGPGWNGRCDLDEHRRFQNNSPTRLQDLHLNLSLQNQDKMKENKMAKSILKVKVNDTVRYINCNVHSAKYNDDETIELLIRIGRQTMWVPRSEVTLAQPLKVTDLK